ncbi:putative 4,5:9,10-diseco-3-hydroxy-5,9, 17-trioxoandrosta-1(10),2-diene-4-oate hydrolase-like [Cocos nucifera]|uniref:Putative 4,5:9,10-diseco-3-hydroxy-5,9, 17-trioxoandrosta-1(10),2-diene-4-oate hydrolase-like n=1 Tax=Cocos nucifera TaxID=13894 RepID=A0A8K0I969_COCNU|nr:putative 4,5:9,10-diseco-3-hydroxy-5,9, 17-trioxoandrosta-1(10),2-diene-4-oate hydrolase-like [Cocos nucifera]
MEPLPVLKQETLILWGDQDEVFPLSLAYQLQRHLGAKSRLEVIKDAGHALQLEKPEHVNRLIKWFLLNAKDTKST